MIFAPESSCCYEEVTTYLRFGRHCSVGLLRIYACGWVGASAWARVFAFKCVALLIQHALRMRHIAICSFSGATVFVAVISQGAQFLGKKVTVHKIYILIFSTTFV
jgi:hypothetical protein